MIGVLALAVVGFLLIYQERQATLKQWQLDAVQRSSAATSSYYASLIRNLVLGNSIEVESIMDINKKGENLLDIRIVPHAQIPIRILETCEVDNNQSFFHQVPACYKYTGSSFIIYHELRSVGYNLGYLVKEVSLPAQNTLGTKTIAINVTIVIACFMLINGIMLIGLRKYFIKPIKMLVQSLQNKHTPCEYNQFRIKELGVVAQSMKLAFEAIQSYQSRAKKLEYEAKLGEMARQVAHDIRSPLTALSVCAADLNEVPEDRRILVRSAVQRIEDIANDLVGRHSNMSVAERELISVQLVSSSLDSIISEKRMQYRSRFGINIQSNLDGSSYGIFARMQPNVFKRIVSNLINNAAEAGGGSGNINIYLKSEPEYAIIEVVDDGKGIPKELLSSLCDKGVTHGKKEGSGLGLYHAKSVIKEWSGFLEIISEVGKGTCVRIKIPRAMAPRWFVPSLTIDSDATIVVLDDDASIHHVWQRRFENITSNNNNVSLVHFTSTLELKKWYKEKQPSDGRVLFLNDYELIGSSENGIDVAKKLNECKRTILVTSRYNEVEIQTKCRNNGVRIIPKGLAYFVPILLESEIISASKINEAIASEFILIDDDELVRQNWKFIAKKKKQELSVFDGPEEFIENSHRYSKSTTIYIDSNLANGIKGEEVAREIHAMGFKNIYIETGYDASGFKEIPWIKGVIGKTPPW